MYSEYIVVAIVQMERDAQELPTKKNEYDMLRGKMQNIKIPKYSAFRHAHNECVD